MIRLIQLVAFVLTVTVGLTAFLLWSERRPDAHYLSDLRTHLVDTPAATSDAHNVVLAQLQLSPVDYQTIEHLRLKLDTVLTQARTAGMLRRDTLVVLPDHIGTWLLATGEKVEFYQSRDRYEIRDWLLLGNPLLAMKALLVNLDANRLDEALLRMKAEAMARTYQQLFSDLARRYGVTLVAGSILLPSPSLDGGELHAGDGPLRNTSLAFAPDGNVIGTLYAAPWPFEPRATPQRILVAGRAYQLERDIQDDYLRVKVRRLDTGEASVPLFLRGTLDWPIGGLSRRIGLSAPGPLQDGPPGTHLISIWPSA